MPMALEVGVSGQSLPKANKPKTSRICRKYTTLTMSWIGKVLIKAVVEKSENSVTWNVKTIQKASGKSWLSNL